jgi:hypothetical protein
MYNLKDMKPFIDFVSTGNDDLGGKNTFQLNLFLFLICFL